ncbi:MAG: hypothetical protein BGO05_09875 [Rhizobiales bacterium 63-7]|nr:hypothetical protein [Hyphomicrobiales bacterium]OJU71383.1 MAG: hypothetical protein BGO05_09875 [Rhizobiales bacterium 63-7]
MNIKRGLFRSWVVVSLLWLAVTSPLVVGMASGDKWVKGSEWWEKEPLNLLPVRCEEAKGQAGSDYQIAAAFEPWNKFREPGQACFYTLEHFRAFWPEYENMDKAAVSKALYSKIGWSMVFDGDRFENTKTAAMIAIVPPVAIYLIGLLVMWAVAGFRKSPMRAAE